VWGLRWQTYLHFARHLAAESAGGSVRCNANNPRENRKMDTAIGYVNPVDLIWALPVFFSVHELEEWNILDWYKKYYKNLPESTNFSIHLHIIAFCLIGFLALSQTSNRA
jgi:hypothetical protein